MSILQIPTARKFAPLLKPARYKSVYGGRGSGKSRFFAGLYVEENIAERMDFACLREIQKSTEFSVKKEIVEVIQEFNAGAYFDVQDRRILTKQGGVTLFDGMQNHTSDSIRSLSRFRRAWVEEAHALSKQSLDVLRPTLREPGSQLWFSWNPQDPKDAVDAFFRQSPPENAIVVQANYMDNPWFPDELRAEMEHDLRTNRDSYEHIWLGGYRRISDALVFKNWRVEEFDTPPGAEHRLGADWGFSVDPSVLLRCHVEGRAIYVDYEAYMVGCEIDRLPDLFDGVPDARKWFITADSARPETIDYMRRHGFPRINAAVKGPKSVEEGVTFLQSYDIVVHRRCRHLIDELARYSYKLDKATNQPMPLLEDKNNHCIDAMRYALEGYRRNIGSKRKVSERTPALSGAWMG